MTSAIYVRSTRQRVEVPRLALRLKLMGNRWNMPTAEVEPVVIESGIGDRVGLRCMVCPHSWDSHDQIGARFCTATAAAGLLDRGCVCIGNTNQTGKNNGH